MFLTNKKILILSPQSWGKMYLSKHHYAIELANKGNIVFFLNPPAVKSSHSFGSVLVSDSGIKNLFIIDHKLNFPYNIKFHFIGLFHMLMRPHVRKILKAMQYPPDIIWSFDLGSLYPFRLFGEKSFRIFHPVDEPLNKTAIDSAKGCQIIFSVTHEILEKYKMYNVPKFFINHGVSKEFLQRNVLHSHFSESEVKIGLSGNLIRKDIDRHVLLKIFKENPSVSFHLWGSYHINDSNISGSDDEETNIFIKSLKNCPNVTLHGPVSSGKLAIEIQNMDAFLICYDVKKDQSRGTNYHKVMEYLSTGKVIVSNNITTYKEQPSLIQMVTSRENNDLLPSLFKKVIANLSTFNSPENQQTRIAFALENLYEKQLIRIDRILRGTLINASSPVDVVSADQ